MLDQGASLVARYRGAIESAQLAALEEDRRQLVAKLQGFTEPSGGELMSQAARPGDPRPRAPRTARPHRASQRAGPEAMIDPQSEAWAVEAARQVEEEIRAFEDRWRSAIPLYQAGDRVEIGCDVFTVELYKAGPGMPGYWLVAASDRTCRWTSRFISGMPW
jgi:hypothetical protein